MSKLPKRLRDFSFAMVPVSFTLSSLFELLEHLTCIMAVAFCGTAQSPVW